MGDFLFSVSCVSCSRRYSGDSSLPPPFLSSPSLSLFSRPPVSALVVLCAPPPLARLLLSISRISLFRPFPLFCVREFCERIFLSVFLFVHFSVIVCRHVCMFIPPDCIRHLLLLSVGFLLLFRRMLSGIFCVHCAACYAACFVSIVRDIIPLRPIPPTPVGLTLGATPPSSFLPSISRYVVYRYLGIFDVLPAPLCPVR